MNTNLRNTSHRWSWCASRSAGRAILVQFLDLEGRWAMWFSTLSRLVHHPDPDRLGSVLAVGLIVVIQSGAAEGRLLMTTQDIVLLRGTRCAGTVESPEG